MRFVCFSQDGSSRFGVIREEVVHAFPDSVATLAAYLAIDATEREALPTHAIGPVSAVQLVAPVAPRKNVFCVGRNYMGHAEEIARARGTELRLPSVPTFFTKAPTAIAGPGATLHLSGAVSQEYDYEAELAVVIGKRCRDVSERDALGVVFGYTCLNDVTARDLQKAHQQWFKGKSLDETCPIGPWIVSADEIGDPQTLDIALRIDGVTKQSSNTAQMIFNVAQIIASLSAGMTLEPGDTIATGTPDGVGFARTPPEFLRDGARMEVEIAKIGILRNTIEISPAS
jgi:2-keto-4-pentenoate hydratase/2-oxohepta-3-ene-1,7-dioic acid hydratase in catechol pathway